MTEYQVEWSKKRDELVAAIKQLGFPKELGEQIAKQLGSPKAMDRMLAYLYNVKPHTAELIVDEMLAMCSDIDTWHPMHVFRHPGQHGFQKPSWG